MKTVRRICYLVCILAAAFILAPAPSHAQQVEDVPVFFPPNWFEVDADGDIGLHLYFFWSSTCPHCRVAHPFVESLPEQLPWLTVHMLELSESQQNVDLYVAMANSVGEQAQYVPAFFFCDAMMTGYDTAETTGATLVQNLTACRAAVEAHVASSQQVGPVPQATETAPPAEAVAQKAAVVPAAEAAAPEVPAENPVVVAPPPAALPTMLSVPLLGTLNTDALSLPVLTVVIAGLDAFNPCAFFVLMFLLSLMIHARSRLRMLLIGSLFVLISGIVYFVFMAAWLNAFLLLGELQMITMIAGAIAIAIAAINIKDYFRFKQGVSLSIPERAKPGLYQRTRNLLKASSLPVMLAGTAVLAIAANSYELLCTAGFPMLFTRTLTLHDLPTSLFYTYLAIYNVIYIIPLLLIVIVFSVQFRAHKLTEDEGRILKLVSGLMMLFLGILLVVAPQSLSNLATTGLLLLLTAAVTLLIVLLDRFYGGGAGHPPLRKKMKPH